MAWKIHAGLLCERAAVRSAAISRIAALYWAIAITVICGCDQAADVSNPPQAQTKSEVRTPKNFEGSAANRQANAAKSSESNAPSTEVGPWPNFKPTPTPKHPEVTAGANDDCRFVKIHELRKHAKKITHIAVTPDATRAVVCDAAGKLLVWTLGDLGKTVELADGSPITAVAVSPDGKFVVAADETGRVAKWDLESGRLAGTLKQQVPKCTSIAMTADPRYAAMVDGDDRILFVDIEKMDLLDMLHGHEFSRSDGYVELSGPQIAESDWRLSWSRDGQILYATNGSRATVLRIPPVRVVNGRRLPRHGSPLESDGLQGHTLTASNPGRRIQDIEPALDDTQCVVAFDDGVLSIVTLEAPDKRGPVIRSVDPKKIPRLYGRPTQVRDIMILPGGNYLAAYGGGESMDMYYVGKEGGEPAAARVAGDNDGVTNAVICPDGRHAISGFEDGRVVLYEMPRPLKVPKHDRGRIYELATKSLAEGNYEKLEALAAELRAEKYSSDFGYPDYQFFYSCVSTPKEPSELEWTKLLQRVKDWQTAKPDSVFPQIALSSALVNYGWEARGSGFAGTISAEGAALFRERLIEAGKILADAQQIDTKDPAIYLEEIQVMKGMGLDKDRLRELFDHGYEADPNYYPLYSALAQCLLPRWYGEPEDAANFLNEMCERMPGDDGLALYAYVVSDLIPYHSSVAELTLLGFDFDKVAAGAEILLERYPYSTAALNLAAWTATQQRDRSAARDRFGWTGDDLAVSYWRSQETFDRARRWALEMEAPQGQVWCALASMQPLSSVAFSPDGTTLAVGSFERIESASLWDVATGERRAVLPHELTVMSVAFSPDGTRLATAGGESTNSLLRLWNLDTDEPVDRDFAGPLGALRCVRFSRDGKSLAAGGVDEVLWIWDLTDAEAKPKQIKMGSKIFSLDYLADGSSIAVVCETGAKIINLGDGTRKEFTFNGGKLVCLRATPSEIYLGGHPCFIMRWRIGEASPAMFYNGADGHVSPAVECLDVSVANPVVAAGINYPAGSGGGSFGTNRAIVLRADEANRVSQLATFFGHEGRISGARLSPDGKLLATVGWDGLLRVWRVPTAQDSASP